MKRILIFIGAIMCTSLYLVNAAEETEVLNQDKAQEKTEEVKKGEEDKALPFFEEVKEEKKLKDENIVKEEAPSKEEDNLIKNFAASNLIEDLHKSENENKEEAPKAETVSDIKGSQELGLDKPVVSKSDNLEEKDILDALDDEDLDLETDDLEALIDDKKGFDI